jgi:hypothetical protein
VTAYQQTLPFYICEATFEQCINNHPNDAEGQATCTSNEKCGTLNATAANSASSSSAAASSTSASQTSVATSSGTGSASASAASASHSSTASNQQLATGAFAAILVAAFKLFL